MPYTPYTGGELPTLLDLSQRLDPDGSIAAIAEVLTSQNQILEDIPLYEGNQATGHLVTVRSDIPAPTWRRINYGVRPTKSATTQVTETIGILEDRGEVDVDLAELNGNTAEFMLSENVPHIQGISDELATTIFYGDVAQYPDRFHGLAPRYDVVGQPANKFSARTHSAYLNHVISAGGATASKQTSIWLIGWGKESVFGIYPKGSKAGLYDKDLGEITAYDNDGGRFQAYAHLYKVKQGFCVKDWRYVVRICNIELEKMDDAVYQKYLYQALVKAMYTVPQNGRFMFYGNRAVLTMLDLAGLEKLNAALGWREVFGKELRAFRGIPIRSCDAILETEAVVS